jgi:hypothetical protein
MSDIITTAQDSFREQCIEVYFGLETLVHRMVERSREERGQTAAEYMGVLLVVGVIIALVAKSSLASDIKDRLVSLVGSIGKGDDPTAG